MPRDQERGFKSRKAGATNIPKGNNYLLVIGIDDYANGIPRLNNAVRDAKAFRDLLWQQYQFEPQHTLALFNQQATRKEMIRTFYQLIDQIGEQDNLVFYFSGHGQLHRTTNRGFWVPADAGKEEYDTYLNNLEVIEFIQHLKARHVFGVVDSCFSGALFAQRSIEEVTRRQYTIPSRWLLTSGRLEPVADGSLGGNSPFAESLLSQLRYQDEEAIWVSELCPKVLKGVAFNTNQQMPRGEPIHNVGHQGGEFIFFNHEADPNQIIMPKKETESPEKTQIREVRPEKALDYQNRIGESVILDLQKLEQAGLKQQAELIIAKLNHLEQTLISETDPSRQFKYEQEVSELKDKLDRIKNKLS